MSGPRRGPRVTGNGRACHLHVLAERDTPATERFGDEEISAQPPAHSPRWLSAPSWAMEEYMPADELERCFDHAEERGAALLQSEMDFFVLKLSVQ